jgi:anti-anti-sigma factor
MTNIIPDFDLDNDDSLKIDLLEVGGIEGALSLALTGYLDTYNSASFQKRVQKVIDSGYKRLIFDCGKLNYVSSTGIGLFTAFLKTVKSADGDIVLYNVQPKVFDVFQLLGFSRFFNIKDSRSDAENYFRGGRGLETDAVFPHIFACPICAKKLKAVKAGRFRCTECKTILAVDERGGVFLG